MIGYGIWGSEKVTYGRHIHQGIFFTQTLISETVHSIAAPLMRAGEVEDARLKGLYALQAGQTAMHQKVQICGKKHETGMQPTG